MLYVPQLERVKFSDHPEAKEGVGWSSGWVGDFPSVLSLLHVKIVLASFLDLISFSKTILHAYTVFVIVNHLFYRLKLFWYLSSSHFQKLCNMYVHKHVLRQYVIFFTNLISSYLASIYIVEPQMRR